MTEKECLLTILMEECNETAQRASKAIRFGVLEIQPEQSLTNAERIIYEFNDIIAVMEMLCEIGVIPEDKMFDRLAIWNKKQKIAKYMAYSKQVGTVTSPI